MSNGMVLDLVVLGILFISAAVAFMRGFVREVLTIGSLAGAALATFVFGPGLTPLARGWIIDPGAPQPQKLFDLVPYTMLAPVLAYGLVFVAVLIVLTVVTHMISKGVHAAGLGPVDRTLGVVFGLIRGIIIIGLLSLVMNFILNKDQRQKLFADSQTYPYVNYLADFTQGMLPGRDVLGKDGSGKDAAAPVGQGPLEPGQAGRGRSSGGAGYTRGDRKTLDSMVEEQPARKRPPHGFNE